MTDARGRARAAAAWALALGAWLALGCDAVRRPEARREPEPGGRVEPLLTARPQARFDGSLTLAAIFPTLGRYAVSGAQSQRGARLAVEALNQAGGVHGRPLRLLEYGTGSYFVDARYAATLAADEDAVLAIVGSNSSSLSRAVADVAEARAVVQISNVSTANDLTWDPLSGRDRPYVFRVCNSEQALTEQLAAFARDHLRARRAAVLYEVGRTYSSQMARGFVARYTGGERRVREYVYLPLETDFRARLQEIRAFEPDVLFVPGSFTDTTLIAAQARAAGLGATLLGGDGWSNRRLFAGQGPDRPAYYAELCVPAPAFAARYRAAFGEEADGCRALLAHDAVLALAQALRALGPLNDDELRAEGLGRTRRRLREALAGVAVTGAGGALRFDAHGDVRRPVAVMRVERGPQGTQRVSLERLLGGS